MHDPHGQLNSMRNPEYDAKRTIASMLEDTSDKTLPTEYRVGERRSPSAWIALTIMSGFVFIFALMVAIEGSDNNDFAELMIMMSAVIAGVFGIYKSKEAREFNDFRSQYDLKQVGHLHNTDMERLRQRLSAMNALKDYELALLQYQNSRDITRMQTESATEIERIRAKAQAEVARYQAMSSAAQLTSDREFQKEWAKFQNDLKIELVQLTQGHEAKEAENNRVHAASEAEKDRELARDRFINQLQNKIDVIYARMQAEKPDAYAESEYELAKMKAELTRAEQIQKIEDPILRQQMWERFMKERSAS